MQNQSQDTKSQIDFVEQLFEQTLIGILQFDLKGKVHYANAACLQLLGYASDTALPSISLKRHLNKPAEAIKPLEPLLRRKCNISNIRMRVKTLDHQPITLLLNATYHQTLFTAALIDMSEIEETENRLWLFNQAIEQLGDPLAITDKQGTSLYINKAFEEVTGYNFCELFGQKHNLLKSGQHCEAFYQDLWSTILEGKTFSHTFINRKKDGTEFYEEKTITPLKNIDGEVTHFVSTGKDISYRVEIENKLKELAFTDTLTNLLNRRAFEKEFDYALEALKRYQRPFAVLLIDIDDFKTINDKLGHDQGDLVLQKMANILQDSVRKLDRVARWGGEEFLILLEQVNQDHALNIAEKLRHKIALCDFSIHHKITVSIGMTLAEPNLTMNEMIKKTDIALYKAKRNGKNQVCLSPISST